MRNYKYFRYYIPREVNKELKIQAISQDVDCDHLILALLDAYIARDNYEEMLEVDLSKDYKSDDDIQKNLRTKFTIYFGIKRECIRRGVSRMKLIRTLLTKYIEGGKVFKIGKDRTINGFVELKNRSCF